MDYQSQSSLSESGSSNQQQQKQQAYFKVFQHDHYLSGSLPQIQNWNSHINKCLNKQNQIDTLLYLEQEYEIFLKEQNFLLANYHIRYFAFAQILAKSMKQIISNYEHQYKQWPINLNTIQSYDKLVVQMSIYFQKILLTRAEAFIGEIDQNVFNNIFQSYKDIFPLIIDPYCIWRVILCLEMTQQGQSDFIMTIPINMKLDYYLKTFKAIKSKDQFLSLISVQISGQLQKKNYFEAYLMGLNKLHNQQHDVPNPLISQYLCCLRYIYFCTDPKYCTSSSLYLQYIFSSIKLPHFTKNQNLPNQYYQKLFFDVLNNVQKDQKLLDLALYIDPNVIVERSQNKFGQIQKVVLKIAQKVIKTQQNFLKHNINPTQKYIQRLLNPAQFTLLIQFIQTIMTFNKSAFLKANNQTYQIFLQMAELLKSVFLSFGKDVWLFPQDVFTPLTLGFFKKISQDINDDLKNILYQMVQNLNQDKLPKKLVYIQNEFTILEVNRLQYLSAICYYLEDCSRESQYLNLPQIIPCNLQTSILCIKSFHFKLKHHQPNPSQLPLFVQYLKQCQKYKLKINFTWFKQQDMSYQREIQFQIERGISSSQIRQYFRKSINFRDRQYLRKLIEETYNLNRLKTPVQIASLLKYNHGAQNIPQLTNIKQEQVFMLIQQIQTILMIIPQQLIKVPLQQQININYLHLLLKFYRNKIKQAKGSLIYQRLLQKLLIPFLHAPWAEFTKFKLKYPCFFQFDIYQYHQLQICNVINQLICQVQEKVQFDNQTSFNQQEKRLVTQLAFKIEIVRDDFLKELNGENQQIQMFFVTFTSIITQNMPFNLFMQCIRLYTKIIIKKPQLQQLTSLDIFLNSSIFKTQKFFQNILKYFNDNETQNNDQKMQIKRKILRHIIQNCEILKFISFKIFISLLDVFNRIQKDDQQKVKHLGRIYIFMQKIILNNVEEIGSNWILPFLLMFFKDQTCQVVLFDSNVTIRKVDHYNNQKNVYQALVKIQSNNQFWQKVRQQLKGFDIKQHKHMFQLPAQIQKKTQSQIHPKDIWIKVLQCLNQPSWTFYYMLNLKDPKLLNLHVDRDKVLINLIKHQKLTKISYPIFKQMINQTKNMQQIVQKILIKYQEQQNRVENYQFHNKLILINQKLGDKRLQKIILRWIQTGENKLPLKIPQSYYIDYIRNRLKEVPQNIGQQMIFKVHKNQNQFKQLSQKVQNLFQVLLYFPIKKFKLFNSEIQNKTNQNNEDDGEWQENSQDQDQQTQTKDKKHNKNSQSDSNSDHSHDEQNSYQDHHSQDNDQNNYDQGDNDYYNDNRPQILQIFTQQDSSRRKDYKQLCRIRQQIDIYIKGDYKKLLQSPIQDNTYLIQKLFSFQKLLQNFYIEIQQSIIKHLPPALFTALQRIGYKQDRIEQQINKLRKKKTKMQRDQDHNLFSDRNQSDDQQSQQPQYNNNYDQDDYYQSDSSHSHSTHKKNTVSKHDSKIKPKKDKQQLQQQLPQLTSKFSKIQHQIKGNQLTRLQLTKVLQIFILQLFKLSPLSFRKKQTIFSYYQIMQSQFNQIFFESVLTILRMNQNTNKNKKIIINSIKKQLIKFNTNQLIQLDKSQYHLDDIFGLTDLSRYNGLVNFAYLITQIKQNHKIYQPEINPFTKQSGSILPIAQKFIIQFDLPIQTNVFSLALLYIQSKNKIRTLLEDIVDISGQKVKLSKKQLKRLCQAFVGSKSHYGAWQYLQQTLNYKIEDIQRLTTSLQSYSKQVYSTLNSSFNRLKQSLNEQVKQISHVHINTLKHYQRQYYISSNLLNSCSTQIWQFYFMNKTICKYLWDEDQDNQDQYNYKKVPKKLRKAKDFVYTNQNFIHLLELAIRIVYFVKDKLYDKISVKRFNRLVRYPKLIIQVSNMYMHLSASQNKTWNFKPTQTVRKFITNYKLGDYKFKSMIQVYNLILGLLDIQCFSTRKFKHLLLPYLISTRWIGLSIPLIFKVPQISDDISGQNILVTRQCSFDMAFYQVNSSVLFVQFYGEEGSDHGGLIRQFMIGWNGIGFTEEYFFIGKILGISFNQSVPYGGPVDLQICIRLTNTKVSMQNLQQIDKQIYESLKFIKQNDPTDLCLTFSIMKKNPKSFQPQQLNLKAKGNQIYLTQQNKQQYIDLYLQNYYKVGRQQELEQIAVGFYTVVYQPYASIFKPHQLMQHIKGQEVCDVNVLKAHVNYAQGYTEASMVIKWIWQILETFNQQKLNKFIQFLTGSPKLPIFNPNFSITFEKTFQIGNLPVAHTCFNTLDIPEYPTKQILEAKLLTAILEGNDNFGIL